jgi:hypothetical protein
MADDGADPDLVAYLDGELDPAAARELEDRLALDPALRAKADALRRSFALLDALPRPDPPADFTARTVTLARKPIPVPGWRLRRPAVVAAVVLLAGSLGAVARVVSRPGPAAVGLDDLPVIENLPLYLGADDLAFVRRLDDPTLFAGRPHPLAPADPPAEVRDRLTAVYQGYPAGRRRQLRQLHADLAALPAAERDRLGAVLERYAGWLDRLPDPDRTAILAAPSADARLTAVRAGLLTSFQDGLPPAARERLAVFPPVERLAVVGKALADARQAHADWDRAADRWGRPTGGARPWPFDQPTGPAEVLDYLRAAVRCDPSAKADPDGCRLSPGEAADLRARYDAAVKDGHWFLFGLQVWRLDQRHPASPRHRTRPPPLTPRDLADKVRPLHLLTDKRLSVGKWPEFAREAAGLLKKGVGSDVLGPCRPGEFADDVEAVLAAVTAAADAADRGQLDAARGRWPDFPDLFLKLAKAQDRPVPGVTPPGPPSRWAEVYARP